MAKLKVYLPRKYKEAVSAVLSMTLAKVCTRQQGTKPRKRKVSKNKTDQKVDYSPLRNTNRLYICA